jgi:hypothetical protein
MNYGRLAIAAVVAAVVDMAYGYTVYGIGMASQFAAAPGVFRPMDVVNGHIPLMALGTLVGMVAAVFIYAKGYEGGSGAAEGLRFGILVGVLMAGYVLVGDYVTMNIGRRLAASLAGGTLVEWGVVGAAIGLVYKPAASPRKAGV